METSPERSSSARRAKRSAAYLAAKENLTSHPFYYLFDPLEPQGPQYLTKENFYRVFVYIDEAVLKWNTHCATICLCLRCWSLVRVEPLYVKRVARLTNDRLPLYTPVTNIFGSKLNFPMDRIENMERFFGICEAMSTQINANLRRPISVESRTGFSSVIGRRKIRIPKLLCTSEESHRDCGTDIYEENKEQLRKQEIHGEDEEGGGEDLEIQQMDRHLDKLYWIEKNRYNNGPRSKLMEWRAQVENDSSYRVLTQGTLLPDVSVKISDMHNEFIAIYEKNDLKNPRLAAVLRTNDFVAVGYDLSTARKMTDCPVDVPLISFYNHIASKMEVAPSRTTCVNVDTRNKLIPFDDERPSTPSNSKTEIIKEKITGIESPRPTSILKSSSLL